MWRDLKKGLAKKVDDYSRQKHCDEINVTFRHNDVEDRMKANKEGYERYVLAQFKFSTQVDIEKEQQAAIQMLIPGSQSYYHLFFLDLAQKKIKFKNFSDSEKKIFYKFKEAYHYTAEFLEVDTWLNLINPLKNLEGEDIDSDKIHKKNLKLIDRILQKYLQNPGASLSQHANQPYFMRDDAYVQNSIGDQIDQNEQKRVVKKTEYFVHKFDRIQKLQQQYDRSLENKSLSLEKQFIHGLEDEIDWSKFESNNVYFYAKDLALNPDKFKLMKF